MPFPSSYKIPGNSFTQAASSASDWESQRKERRTGSSLVGRDSEPKKPQHVAGYTICYTRDNQGFRTLGFRA